MKTCPVVVIGHVDHGKTSLVRALTGMETDRLPEEKARGLSITPGFAYRQCRDVMIDFIDAPGHENFVRAMVSGASGARAALLVISAVEGVQAQTLEHLQIAEFLGIDEGIVAVTQSDRLSKASHAAREAEQRAALSNTQFCDAPIIFCSSATGQGIDALVDALGHLGLRSTGTEPVCAPLLPVDRVFVAEGRGTVVTGTLQGGSMQVEEGLVIAGKGQSTTIRGIHVRGQESSQANPGERTALNLRGISANQIKPGDLLHAADAFVPSIQCDVVISLSPRASRPVRHMQQVRVLYGTAHAVASVRFFAGTQLDPGTSVFAQLRFPVAITTFAGQRTIIRSLSPAQTLGGAIILDPVPDPNKANKKQRIETLKAAQRGDTHQIAVSLAREHQGIARIADICRLARRPAMKVREELAATFIDVTTTLVSPSTTVEEARENYLARLQSCHAARPLKPFAPRATMYTPDTARALIAYAETVLASEGKLVLSGTDAALATHSPLHYLTKHQQDRMAWIVAKLRAGDVSPPAPETLFAGPDDADLLALLVHEGVALRLYNVSLGQSLVFHADAIAAAATILKTRYPGKTAFTTGEARETLNTTRKFIIPILEYLDSQGTTIRRGDTRYIADV
ncbi:MAG: selenocysteine-specific translation elongation factor [Hyphomonas sp.]|uniref:selenocysteine-specific translation elongation factor n=1 Tax=Hyphomonas sp. TaxID=87 RepID=UPI0030015B5E